MNTRQVMARGAGVHRVKPPVRWVWAISLISAVISGTYEWIAQREPTAQSPTTTEMSSTHPHASSADQRT